MKLSSYVYDTDICFVLVTAAWCQSLGECPFTLQLIQVLYDPLFDEYSWVKHMLGKTQHKESLSFKLFWYMRKTYCAIEIIFILRWMNQHNVSMYAHRMSLGC